MASADPAPGSDSTTAVTYQGDPAHDGNSLDPSFIAPLTKRWSTTFGGDVSYPLVADGRVFVSVAHSPNYGNDVEALSLSTGEVLWGPVSIGGTYWVGSIAYDAGRVFAINYDGQLEALDAATGAVQWTTQLPGQDAFTSPPTAVGGRVYVGGSGNSGTLYAVDEAGGSVAWTAFGGDHSSAAVDDTGVYESFACERTFKFNLDGSDAWDFTTGCGGGGGRTSVLHDGRLYVRDTGNKTPVVLDASTGTQVSTFHAGPAPAFDGSHMAAVSQGVLSVSDASTGDQIWRAPTSDAVTAPLVANGYVVEGLRDGTIETRNVQDGHMAWRGKAGAKLDSPDEQGGFPLNGLAQAEGVLVVPAGPTLTVFEPAGDTTVRLTAGPTPDVFARSTAATFSFASGVLNPQYVCTLDGVSAPCTSPVRYSNLRQGRHQFSVSIAYATAGVATRGFRVDTIAPATRVAAFSPHKTRAKRVTGRWSGSDSGSGIRAFQTRTTSGRTGKALAPWSVHGATTATSTSLALRRHSRTCVSVRAQDRVGNWSGWSTPQCVTRR